jgi:hypothetical protein
VAADYRVERGFVLPLVDGKPIEYVDIHRGLRRMKQYMPMAHPELPAEFAKIDGRGQDAVLAFVRLYGLPGLWKYQLGAPRRHGPEPLCGDPLAWILAHARSVRLVGELARALNDEAQLAQQIEELRVTGPGIGFPLSFPLMRRDGRYPSSWAIAEQATPRDTALWLVTAQLNNALAGVQRIVVFTEGHLESRFVPDSLIDCIYWLLADAVVGSTLRRCSACGRFFVTTHDRMKFCPPPMGLNGPSRCMNREKVRRWREEQRQPKQTRRRRRRKGAR